MTTISWVRERADHRSIGLVLLLALAAGCGGAASEGAREPTEARGDGDAIPEPVELSIRTPSGRWVHVGDLRGKPVLLAFLATYDGVSQAALQPLGRLVRHRDDVEVVGVMLQQEAELFADAWVHALDPPFPVGWDPDHRVMDGQTALGTLETVPTFIVLDSAGVEVDRRVGFQSERNLGDMVERALRSRPLVESGPPPLMGTPRGR